jgi:hypothetical protein
MILCDVYPGIQSILTPAEGTDHEWITSFDEAKICSLSSTGIATAPVECRRSILLIPLRRGLNWFLLNSPEFVKKCDVVEFPLFIKKKKT